MKTAEAKPASKQAARTEQPFFNKGAQGMLSNTRVNEHGSFISAKQKPFFANNKPIQAKLTIGSPNDKYEREADHVADKVVQRLSKNETALPQINTGIQPKTVQPKPIAPVASITQMVQAKCANCEQEEKLQKKEEEKEAESVHGKLQKKRIFDSNAEPPPDDDKKIQRKCAECEKEEKLQKRETDKAAGIVNQQIQLKPIFESNNKAEERVQRKCAECEKEEHLQKKNSDSSSQTAPPSVESSLSASRGGGSPLSESTRSQMESSIGADFSGVRVHNNSVAAELSDNLNAQAFTHGNDIYFNSGKYDTNSSEGKHLLAHELTHTVQQGGGEVRQQRYNVNQVQRKLEANAQHVFEDSAASSKLSDAGQQSDKDGKSADTQGGSKPGEKSGAPGANGSTEEKDKVDGSPEKTPSKGAKPATATNGDSSTGSAGNSSSSGGSATGSPASAPGAEGANPQAGTLSPGTTAVAPGATPVDPASPTPNGPATQDAQRTGPAPAAGQASKGGDCTPACFRGIKEEPAEEPTEKPPDPAPTEVKAEPSEGNEEDLPEIDVCPMQEADAAVAGAKASNTPEAAAPGATGPEASSSGPGKSPGTSGKKAADDTPKTAGVANEEASAGTAPPAADSALAGVIASAESQRSAALSAYQNSAAALDIVSPAIESLRGGVQFAKQPKENQAQHEQRQLAANHAGMFFSAIAGKLDDAAALARETIPDQLGATAESAKMQISASMEMQKVAISARIQQARGHVMAKAAVTRNVVHAQTVAYVAEVEAQTAAAIASITATQATTMAQVNALETTTLDTINSVYAGGKTNLEGLGTTIGAECIAKGEEFATTYEGFRKCTSSEDGFFDGDLSGRKADAQAGAARSVAKAYHDRMVDAAHKRAIEVTRNGRKADRCSIIASAGKSRDTLDEQLPALTKAFETTRDAAVNQAYATESNLIASVKTSLSATISQLDQLEHNQRQAINDTGYMQQILQEQIAHAAAAAVQQGIKTAVGSVQQAMQDLQARFASGKAPNPVVLERALSQVEQKINAAMDELHTSANTGTTTAETQLADAAQQALTSLTGIMQGNDESATYVSDGFSDAMNGISGTDNFADRRTMFTTQVQQGTDAGNTALAQVLDGLQKSCDGTLTGARTTLEKASQSLTENLQHGKQGQECEMTQKADEAASKEAPAWKRVLAVVLVIIVIIIVIAVIVVTAGAAGPLIVAALGGPLLAGVIIGAAVGAVTSGLLAMASNLWNNQSVMKGVGKAILIGAVTGAIGGGIGAAAGAGAGAIFAGASKTVQVAAQFGAAMMSAGGVDVVTQYVMGGFSFAHFSKGELGFTLLLTAVTFGLGHYSASRAPVRVGAPESVPQLNAPEATPVTEPIPVPEPAPVSEPTTAPVPEPGPAAGPEPAPVPELEPAAAPEPEPVPETPEPLGEQEPVPAAHAEADAQKAPRLGKEEALKVLDKVNQSKREFYEASMREAYDLAPKGPKTAASAGGDTFASGQKAYPGFEHVPAGEVKATIGEANFPEAPQSFLDQGKPGSYNATHGEPKAATAQPNEPIGVSRNMCKNCQAVMKQVATDRGAVQVVTDRDGTRIFYPNGFVDFIPW